MAAGKAARPTRTSQSSECRSPPLAPDGPSALPPESPGGSFQRSAVTFSVHELHELHEDGCRFEIGIVSPELEEIGLKGTPPDG